MSLLCGICNQEYESGNFCLKCGGKLETLLNKVDEKRCPKCGTPDNMDGSKFCHGCGLNRMSEKIVIHSKTEQKHGEISYEIASCLATQLLGKKISEVTFENIKERLVYIKKQIQDKKECIENYNKLSLLIESICRSCETIETDAIKLEFDYDDQFLLAANILTKHENDFNDILNGSVIFDKHYKSIYIVLTNYMLTYIKIFLCLEKISYVKYKLDEFSTAIDEHLNNCMSASIISHKDQNIWERKINATNKIEITSFLFELKGYMENIKNEL